MIHGAHVIIYSTNAEADRAFFRDTLEYDSVDAGRGWLIFALPPAEVAVHPADGAEKHELYLMCDDVEAFVAEMKSKKIKCTTPSEQGWGTLTSLTLPGGGTLGVYEPHHPSPITKGGKGGKGAAKGGKPAAKSAGKPAPAKKLAGKAARKGTPAKQAFVSAKGPNKKKGVPKK